MNPRSGWRLSVRAVVTPVVTPIVTAVVTAMMLVAGVVGPGPATALAASGDDHRPEVVRTAVSRATVIKRVSPLTAKGHVRARYTVTSTHRGYCWTPSFTNGHLYRCLMGNYILDPCWKESGRHSVICLTEPWSKKVIRLRLTKHLPATNSDRPGIWGLRIGGGVGVNCLISMGAAGEVGRHPISYVCQHGWVLLGNRPDRSRQRWTMLTAKWVGNHYVLRGRKPLPVGWKAVHR